MGRPQGRWPACQPALPHVPAPARGHRHGSAASGAARRGAPVGQQVGVRLAPGQRAELHHADEARCGGQGGGQGGQNEQAGRASWGSGRPRAWQQGAAESSRLRTASQAVCTAAGAAHDADHPYGMLQQECSWWCAHTCQQARRGTTRMALCQPRGAPARLTQVVHLALQVLAVLHAAQVEELGACRVCVCGELGDVWGSGSRGAGEGHAWGGVLSCRAKSSPAGAPPPPTHTPTPAPTHPGRSPSRSGA